jgi:hypothetical protein
MLMALMDVAVFSGTSKTKTRRGSLSGEGKGLAWVFQTEDPIGRILLRKPLPIGLIALPFIVQCALGIAVCGRLLWHFPRTCKRIESLQKKDESTDKVLEGRTTMPLFVYQFSASGEWPRSSP